MQKIVILLEVQKRALFNVKLIQTGKNRDFFLTQIIVICLFVENTPMWVEFF